MPRSGAENLNELVSGAEEFEQLSQGEEFGGVDWEDLDGLARLELYLESGESRG